MLQLKFMLLVLCCLPFMVIANDDRTEDEIVSEFTEDFLACNSDYNVEIVEFNSTNDLIRQAKSENAKCWRKCYLQSTGIVDGDGKLLKEYAVNHVHKIASGNQAVISSSNQIVDNCAAAQTATEPCVSAVQVVSCLVQNVRRIQRPRRPAPPQQRRGGPMGGYGQPPMAQPNFRPPPPVDIGAASTSVF